MSNDDKWIKNLRDRMEDYSEPLPGGLWEQLEEELARPKVVPLWKRWSTVAAAAVVLAVSSIAFWQLTSPAFDSEEMQQSNQLAERLVNPSFHAEEPVLPLKTTESKQAENKVKDVQENSKSLRPVTSYQSKGVLAMGTTESKPKVLSDEALVATSEKEMQPEVSSESLEDKEEVKEPLRRKDSRKADREIWKRNAENALLNREKNESGKIQLGLLSGGMPYASSKEFRGMSRFTSRYSAAKVSHEVMDDGRNALSAYNRVLLNNRHENARTQVKHRLPIMVSASVKWNFSEKWALETGLNYTFLQSELRSGSNLYLVDTQKLHYVGIPVKIHRAIWNNSRLAVYASAGGMVEKCVAGTLETSYVTGNGDKETESVDLHIHPLQCSLAASVGAQLNFTRVMSLFVEPGMAYYFDDGSKVETIRKEHPFNFDLRFGLRFNLSK